MKHAIGLILLSLLTLAAPAHALDPQRSFHHYVRDAWTIEQGLPQISALAIAQDADAYIWVGTQGGLARFDGVRFVTFTPNDTPELPGMLVQCLLADPDGRLWIGTYLGLALREHGEFRAVPRRDADGEVETVDVRALARMSDGRMAVSTSRGLHWVEDGELVPDARLASAESFGLLTEGDALLIGSRGAVLRLDKDGIQSMPLGAELEALAPHHFAFESGRLWAGTNSGLLYSEQGRWHRFEDHPGLAHSPIDAIGFDSDDNLWIASHAGLARLRHGSVREFIEENEPFSHRSIRAVFEDRERNLWLGSQWQGVARLWNGWVERYSESEGLHTPILWSLARADDGTIWAGNNDGLSTFDGRRFHQVLKGSDLPHPNAYTLLAEDDRLWIGTRAGLAVYADGQVLRPQAFAAMDGIQINGILRDRRQQLWLATMGGLFRWDEAGLRRFGETEGLVDPRVRVLLEMRDGTLLAGTQRGVYRYQDGRFVAHDAERGLPGDIDVTALLELAGGSLVLGTLNEDLFLGDTAGWTRFGHEHGLPVNSPFFLAEDARGFLWVAGIRGVYRVPISDLHGLRAGHLQQARGEMLINERGDPRSGQKGHCCNGAGLGKGFFHDDTLWLPTRSGMVTMPTTGILRNEVAPKVVIERLRSDGLWASVGHGSDLVLPAGHRDLAFEFTALSFQDPASVQLRYRLRGYDRDWIMLDDGERRAAVYTNLPPGAYVFEVMGSNNAGLWSAQAATLDFAIQPHFHETGWFDLLIAAAVVALIVVLLARQRRRHERLRQRLQQLVEERTEALQDANRRLEDMSQRDVLTGLRNRRFLIEQMPPDLAYFHRHINPLGAEGPVMLLALLDIDDFKSINDRHGHRAGDLILQQLARLLEQQIRNGDYAVRWGGEEFLLVMRPMLRSQCTSVVERIRHAIESYRFDIGRAQPVALTCSIGMAEYPLTWDAPRRMDWEQLIELADHAMYKVKRGGRNGWAMLRTTATTRFDELPDSLALLADAMIACGELELLHSPALRVADHDEEALSAAKVAAFRMASGA
jgi:diguanylate cyclase (GGDEF)-like protein